MNHLTKRPLNTLIRPVHCFYRGTVSYQLLFFGILLLAGCARLDIDYVPNTNDAGLPSQDSTSVLTATDTSATGNTDTSSLMTDTFPTGSGASTNTDPSTQTNIDVNTDTASSDTSPVPTQDTESQIHTDSVSDTLSDTLSDTITSAGSDTGSGEINPTDTAIMGSDTGTGSPTGAPTDTTPPAEVKVLSRLNDTRTDWYQVTLLISNSSTEDIPMHTLRLRYYFTADETSAFVQVAGCWGWTLGSCEKFAYAFSETTGEKADHYIELSFNTEPEIVLAAGGDSSEIDFGFRKDPQNSYDFSNDWSYSYSETMVENANITLYRDDNPLPIWGQEPQTP